MYTQLFALFCVIAPLHAVFHTDAVLTAACADYGTLLRSDDGGKTITALVTEATWNSMDQTYTFELFAVGRTTIIKVRCRNADGPGGFIGEMTVGNDSYVTTSPYHAGEWRVYEPSMAMAGTDPKDLSYSQNGEILTASGVSSDAYWIEIEPHSSLDFYFRFRRFTKKVKSPLAADEEGEGQVKRVYFDAEKEKAALLELIGYPDDTEQEEEEEEEEIIAAVGVSADTKDSIVQDTVIMAGTPIVAVIAAIVICGACKAKSKRKGGYGSLQESAKLMA